jgi:hypothetical protein
MKKLLSKIEKQLEKLESAHRKEDDIVESIKEAIEELKDVKVCKKKDCDCNCQ